MIFSGYLASLRTSELLAALGCNGVGPLRTEALQLAGRYECDGSLRGASRRVLCEAAGWVQVHGRPRASPREETGKAGGALSMPQE